MKSTAITPSSQDIFRIALINIDNERDFVNEDGLLSVAGAVQAAARTARFIRTNQSRLTTIYSSMDKHGLKHIFYATWWVNQEGNHPGVYSEITAEDVENKIWMPLFEEEWSLNYVRDLRKITVWPVHCVVGTAGSEVVPVISQAIAKHTYLRGSNHVEIHKGQNLRTEHYGIFGAEVEDPQDPSTKLDVAGMMEIAGYNRSYWLGQEANHCVRRSLEQYITWCEEFCPDVIPRMRYVSDCISLLPLGPEYEADYTASLKQMVEKGLVLVESTDPII